MKMSGYRVLPNKSSKTSNWPRVNVVLSLRCFLVLTPVGREKKTIEDYCMEKRNDFETKKVEIN